MGLTTACRRNRALQLPAAIILPASDTFNLLAVPAERQCVNNVAADLTTFIAERFAGPDHAFQGAALFAPHKGASVRHLREGQMQRAHGDDLVTIAKLGTQLCKPANRIYLWCGWRWSRCNYGFLCRPIDLCGGSFAGQLPGGTDSGKN